MMQVHVDVKQVALNAPPSEADRAPQPKRLASPCQTIAFGATGLYPPAA